MSTLSLRQATPKIVVTDYTTYATMTLRKATPTIIVTDCTTTTTSCSRTVAPSPYNLFISPSPLNESKSSSQSEPPAYAEFDHSTTAHTQQETSYLRNLQLPPSHHPDSLTLSNADNVPSGLILASKARLSISHPSRNASESRMSGGDWSEVQSALDGFRSPMVMSSSEDEDMTCAFTGDCFVYDD